MTHVELNIDNKRIEQLFAKFFGLDSHYIHQCYREFKDAYNQKLSSSDKGFIPKQKQSWGIQFQEKTQNHWENSTLIGVDLPLFFKCPDPKAQTVMLVAQDPLRHRNDFPNFKFKDEDVIIGTPFAQHSSKYREGLQKVVFSSIKNIIDNNYHVYITDVYKVWVEQKEYNPPYKLFKKNEPIIFGELLLNELDIIKPKNVICLGKVAEEFFSDTPILKNYNLSKRNLYLPHPGRQNTKTWKKCLINQKQSPENKIKYLKTKIDEYLD